MDATFLRHARARGPHSWPCACAAWPLLLAFAHGLLACETPEPQASPPATSVADGAVSAAAPAIDAGPAPVSGLDATGGSAPDATQAAPNVSALPCNVSAILSQHCGNCHGAERNFGAPMSLVTWNDLHKAAPLHPDR